MKGRTFFLGVLGGAIALFLVGIAVMVGLTANSPLQLLRATTSPAPLAARWIPRQAPLMVSLLVRPDRLWDLRQVLLPAERRFQSRQEWQRLQTWLRQVTGVDYLQDLRPWLGNEITFAITSNDLDGDTDNGQQPGYLLVLTSQNGDQAREALYRFWQQRALGGEEVTLEPQAGLTLIYSQLATASSGGIQRVASTLVGDSAILVANDLQVLRQAIATGQAPDVSLATDPTYRRLIQTLPPGPIGWLYGTLPAALGWLADQPPLPPSAPNTDLQRAFLSWRLSADRAQPTQLIAEITLARRPGAPPIPAESAPLDGSALRWLPAQTTLALSGSDLANLWQELQTGVQGYGLTQALATPLNRLALGTTASPDSPLPPAIRLWAGSGSYALGWLAQSRDWIWINAATDLSATESMPDLDALAQAQGWGVGRVSLGHIPVTVWTQLAIAPDSPPDRPRLTTQVIAVHASVGSPNHPQEIYATSLSALQSALSTQPQTSLLGQPLIAQALSSPNPNTLLYLDWPQWQSVLGPGIAPVPLLSPIINPSTAYLGPMVALTHPPTATQTQGQLWLSLRNP